MTDQGKFELLIDAVIRDGSISDKERGVILARGQELGYSQAEIEIILESRLSLASEHSQATVSFSRKDFDQALVLAEKLVWTHDLDSEEDDMLQKQYNQKRESLKHTILKLRSER